MNKMPFMPMYLDDWFGSFTVQRMSYAARGMYHALLMVQWREGHIGQTADDAREVLRCTDEDWKQFEKFFEQCFPVDADGFRRNPKVSEVKATQIAASELARAKGRMGGRPRKEPEEKPNESRAKAEQKLEHKLEESREKAEPKAEQKLEHKPSESIPDTIYQIPDSNNNPPTPLAGGAAGSSKKDRSFLEPPPDLAAIEGFPEAWADWQSHRSQKHNALTEKSVKLQFKALSGCPDPVECIQMSIRNGWTGLFPEKIPKPGLVPVTGGRRQSLAELTAESLADPFVLAIGGTG